MGEPSLLLTLLKNRISKRSFKKISFAPGKQVIKKETSDEITRMLVNVVDKALRGGTAKIPGYSVAAKNRYGLR